MKISELNKHFPLLDGLIEVQASTKKKQGYIKVAVPDELINHLMKIATRRKTTANYFVIAYHEEEESDQ